MKEKDFPLDQQNVSIDQDQDWFVGGKDFPEIGSGALLLLPIPDQQGEWQINKNDYFNNDKHNKYSCLSEKVET